MILVNRLDLRKKLQPLLEEFTVQVNFKFIYNFLNYRDIVLLYELEDKISEEDWVHIQPYGYLVRQNCI